MADRQQPDLQTPRTWIAVTVAAIGLSLFAMPAAAGETPPESIADDLKTVLVTGANRGLGLEFARQYAAEGWQVIGTARDPQDAAELEATGAEVLQLDVADADSVAALAAALEGRPIDLLINNAGIFPRVSSLAEVDFADVERTYAVNTIGPMRVTKSLLPNLRLGEGKKIVSITSGLGSISDNTGGNFYGYRGSKAALNMFTRTLAAELRDEGFSCVVISPGWVRTDMGGPNANLSPAESVAGMRKVIESLGPEDSGTYRNWDGGTLDW